MCVKAQEAGNKLHAMQPCSMERGQHLEAGLSHAHVNATPLHDVVSQLPGPGPVHGR